MGIYQNNQFTLGVNYWPRSTAMYWWHDFKREEVEEDFARIAESGCEVVRIFLLWEDFQPLPDRVPASALDKLVCVAEAAQAYGIRIMPTLFCGHMSGVNWAPPWMLQSASGKQRFPVYSQGRLLANASLRNFYSEVDIIKAQVLQCCEVARALCGHPAVWAYDLGNESSNCTIPPDRHTARVWLEAMVGELKVNSGGLPVVLGMHAEDLEEDRNLWPQDAARYCDFLCMHGYPFYLKWVEDPLDAEVLPFLGVVTRWLGEKPVLFQEFGITSAPVIPPLYSGDEERSFKTPLWEEEWGAEYYRRALALLQGEGMMGAMAWCYTDYHPDLWDSPPLEDNPHERHFGLFRHDGTAKPVVQVIRDFTGKIVEKPALTKEGNPPSWLKGEERDLFYRDPLANLKRLYRTYQERG